MKVKKYISNEVLNHGLGSRVLKMISLIGLSSLLNKKNIKLQFVYNPLARETNNVNFVSNQLSMFYHEQVSDSREKYLQICNNWDAMFAYKGKRIDNVDDDEVIFLVHPFLYDVSEFDVFNETRLLKTSIKEEFNLHVDKKLLSKKKNNLSYKKS